MTIGQMIFAIVFILLFLILLVAAGVWVYAIVKHKDELMFISSLELANGAVTTSPVASEKILDIDLAKDLVVSEGVCRKATAEDVADAGADPGFAVGDYIVVLTIANSGGDKIYIPVQGLVDIYTPEQNASQIQLVIDENNEISATIVAGSVDTAVTLGSNCIIQILNILNHAFGWIRGFIGGK